jgi:hypothetical protein
MIRELLAGTWRWLVALVAVVGLVRFIVFSVGMLAKNWRVLALLIFILLLPCAVHAQTATPANKFGWTEAGQAAATATSASYPLYLDNATAASPALTGVGCATDTTTPANAACTGNIPALAQGQHTAAITQMIAGAESAKSNAVTFQFVIVVNPTGLKIARLLSFMHGGVLTSRGRIWARQQVKNLHRLP